MVDFDSDDFSDASDVNYDSDKELQVAFQKGLLKPGLHVAETRVVRPHINNSAGLKGKLIEFGKPDLAWIERLDVTVERPEPAKTAEDREDDFQRELTLLASQELTLTKSCLTKTTKCGMNAPHTICFKQAQAAVAKALPKFHNLSVPTRRPGDYFTEMAKSDAQMTKVRHLIVKIRQNKERSEAAKKFREQKKFASKVQKEVQQTRLKEKRKMIDAVKQHRKVGAEDDDIDAVLDGKFSERSGESSKAKPKGNFPTKRTKKTSYKAQRFGFGGQKKRSKWNTAESAASMAQFDRSKHSVTSTKKGKKIGHKQKRPGKGRRQKMKNR